MWGRDGPDEDAEVAIVPDLCSSFECLVWQSRRVGCKDGGSVSLVPRDVLMELGCSLSPCCTRRVSNRGPLAANVLIHSSLPARGLRRGVLDEQNRVGDVRVLRQVKDRFTLQTLSTDTQ